MKKIIKIRGLHVDDPITEKEVEFLKCEAENVVYARNDNPCSSEEKFIAYDYKTGFLICFGNNTKILIEKVNELKEKLEKARQDKRYEDIIINEQLF